MRVVATDAPLDARDLGRLAARAVFGKLGRGREDPAVTLEATPGGVTARCRANGVAVSYRDAAGRITERAGAARVRGFAWMTNDAVNFLASVIGAATAADLGSV